MYNLIKKLFTRKEPETLTFASSAVPSWLDDREKKAHERLVATTEEPVRNIRNAAAGLQLIVNNIAGAEDDPVLHPKIKSIAKNSLPLFVKAMNSSLAKELPDDREEFYLAAVECVKSCLNSMRGQGRYLQIVFPEEMKSVKTGIDTMGREINGLTSALSAYRQEMTLTTEIRSLHTTLGTMKEDLARSIEKDARSDNRIHEITARVAAIEKELAELNTGENALEIEEQRSALATREQARDDAVRQYAALSMTASHVFRKADKISQKQHHPPETAALRRVMELLSDHDIPDENDLAGALKAACPIAERMIESGDISLKNKEERALFSDTPRFCSEMCAASREVKTHDEACAAAGKNLAAHPLLSRIQSLEREKKQQQSMLAKEGQNKDELAEWRKKTDEQIPVLFEDLIKKAGLLAGDNVQVKITES